MRGEYVTVISAAADTVDAYGDPVPGDGNRLTVMTLAPLTFRNSTESDARGRGGVVTGATVYLPTGTPITRADHVEARGVLYEVDGDVADWRSPSSSSRTGGLEVALRRAEG